MLAVLLLFALVNGLLVYSIIKDSDSESVEEFNKIMEKDDEEVIDSWLNIAYSMLYPHVVLSRKHPDSLEVSKERVQELLKETHWGRHYYDLYRNDRYSCHGNNCARTKKYNGFYFIFDSKDGNAVMFMDTLGRIMQESENVLEITDADGKKFVREIQNKAFEKDFSIVPFKYFKPGINEAPVEGLAKGIYIEDWNWVVVAGNYSDKIHVTSKFFTEKFEKSRLKLVGNLFGIMLVSFLVGLFMIFKQMNSFTLPLTNLSNYLHRLANEGIRFEDFNMELSSQEELKKLAADLNALVRNVGSLIENVRVSADRVSDLSGACTDMLDIVDYDAKLVGQRTVEMSVYSENVIDNVNGMAVGIEEIYINLDGLKKLTSHIAENTTDIKSSVSQMSESMKELNEKSLHMQNSVLSVTQAVNDIGLASTEELSKINSINEFSVNMLNDFEAMEGQIMEFRKQVTQAISVVSKQESLAEIRNIGEIAEDLYNKIASIQTRFAAVQNEDIVPLKQVVEERKNLSKEIYSDTLNMDTSIGSVVSRISEINSNSQYINSNIKYMSGDINEAYRNLEEIVNSTDGMNEHAKQAIVRMDEFSMKLKRVEEAHSAIEHTMVDAKDSMKSLNDLSANLRKVVDDLVRLDRAQIAEESKI
jgi:methyl-accepting chemotaxis protein